MAPLLQDCDLQSVRESCSLCVNYASDERYSSCPFRWCYMCSVHILLQVEVLAYYGIPGQALCDRAKDLNVDALVMAR